MEMKESYGQDAVSAAKSVLIEVCHILGEYKESIVLVGGWVPQFIIPQNREKHMGSIDVDLALDHKRLQEEGYQKIEKLLLSNKYVKTETAHRYKKTVGGITVYVDLLAGEYGGTGRGHRHQRVQNLNPRKARGCDLAFECPKEEPVRGSLPNGDEDEVVVRIASIVSFLVMKGMALDDRMKDKDAYDIYYCVVNYPGGISTLAAEFAPFKNNTLVQEGLEKIRKAFSTIGHIGPGQVARSYNASSSEEERIRRDAFQRINAFLDLVQEFNKE